MRAHSTGQILMEGGVDVNKGRMVYSQVDEEAQKPLLKGLVFFDILCHEILYWV